MNDIYTKLTNSAQKHKYIYHYTSVDAFKAIETSKSIRLSRLDRVNDPMENKRITSLWNSKIFVACFTNRTDNMDCFRSYCGDNGVRLTFEAKDFLCPKLFYDSNCKSQIEPFSAQNNQDNSYSCFNDWKIFDITWADVMYVNSIEKYNDVRGELYAGLVKSKSGLSNKNELMNWEKESETRLRVALRPDCPENVLNFKDNTIYQPKPRFDFIYMDIAGLIKKIDNISFRR